MQDYDQKQLDEFFKAIEIQKAAYAKHTIFSFLALKKGDFFELIKGRLVLQGESTTIKLGTFQSTNVKAGAYNIDDVQLVPAAAIKSLLTGVISTPIGNVSFPHEQDRSSHSIHFTPYHSDGFGLPIRQIQMLIRGNQIQRPETLRLDWELKASPAPFEHLQELCNEFSIGSLQGDFGAVEVLAQNIAALGMESRLRETKAELVMKLAIGLDPKIASMGYKILQKGLVSKRASIPSAEFSWSTTPLFQIGKAQLEVPAGAILQCFVNYAEVTQHHYWIGDPSTALNPYRAVHDTFDNKLEVLNELIHKPLTRNANSRDLETAIAWLLWMLGFSATPIGGVPKTSDAPDIIAATPQGSLLVIECTMGILKEDNKLPHLVERAEKVKQGLVKSSNQHIKILPVLVTTKSREEVKADLEQAYKLGVLVITREGLEELVKRTLYFPDPHQLYLQGEKSLEKHQAQSRQTNPFSEF